MSVQTVPSASDESIRTLLITTIFDPKGTITLCNDYLTSQEDQLYRAHAHYVKFRAHSELFRAAQNTALTTLREHAPEDDAAEHKREAESSYKEAVKLYRTLLDSVPFPQSILTNFDMQELIGVGEFAYVFRVSVRVSNTQFGSYALKLLKQPYDINRQSVSAFVSTLEALKSHAENLPDAIVKIQSTHTDDPRQLFYLMEPVIGERLDRWLPGFREPSAVRLPIDSVASQSTAGTSGTSTPAEAAPFQKPSGMTEHMRTFKRLLQHSTQLHVAKEIAEALRAAHEIGVLHLTLKPSNILISNTEHLDNHGSPIYSAHITDFAFLYLQLAGLPLRGISALTDVLDYLAPETVRDGVDAVQHNAYAYKRADIYAFGRICLYLFSDPRDQEVDTQVGNLILLDPQLAVLLVRCSRRAVNERPRDFAEVVKRLKNAEDDVENRCRQASETSRDASVPPILRWLFRIARAIFASPGDIIVALNDTRQIETRLGGALPFLLFYYAIKRLFLTDPKSSSIIDLAYVPCFFVATTCTVIGYFYFRCISSRCQYYDSRFREVFRFVQCFQYGIPIYIGIGWRELWPFCCAWGYFVIAVNNEMMLTYMKQYAREIHLPYLFASNRRHVTEILSGYVGSGVAAVLAFLIIGGSLVWFRFAGLHGPGTYGFELACSLVVAVVNCIFIKTSLVGEAGERIVRTLAQEYAIRDQGFAAEGRGDRKVGEDLK